jgi:hypothetical protein
VIGSTLVETVVDFGLFEALLVLGFAAAARFIYARRLLAAPFLLASVLLPIALLVLVRTELTRWLAAGSLATALVNAAFIFRQSLSLKGRSPEGQKGHEREGGASCRRDER